MKPVKDVKSKDEARQIAINWQRNQQQESPDLGEIVTARIYFTVLAEKFNLKKEFRENGII